MSAEDTNSMLQIFTDPNVMEAFALTSFSREQMDAWVNRNIQHQESYGYGLFSVILNSSGELIGDCGLENTTFEDVPRVEIGYDFLSRFWNQGYATEAASAVKDYAINVLNIDPKLLCCFIRRKNIASMRVAEKIGMRRTKEYSNNGIDYYLYEL